MSVSIGNQLYNTLEKDNKLYYFHEDIWKKFDYEAASDTVLVEKADYVFEIIKSPGGFTSEQILIKSDQRRMSHIEYNFVPGPRSERKINRKKHLTFCWCGDIMCMKVR